jgi:hypothetical protein
LLLILFIISQSSGGQKCVQDKNVFRLSENVENLNAPSDRTSSHDILAGTRAILFIEYSIMLYET